MIRIDGSSGEGGGQIIRTALALSTLTGKPFEITEIRKNRPKPGLKAQHLFCVRSLKELCHAVVIGDELGSERLVYEPHEIEFKNMSIDIGTAGSITLLLQALLPALIFSDKKISLKITGGTDTMHSMPADYFMSVFLPQLKKYADIDAELISRGYYPSGGGQLNLKISPRYNMTMFPDLFKENNKIDLTEQGTLVLIKGISHASKDLMKAEVSQRQEISARFNLSKLGAPVRIESEYTETSSTGSGITLWAIFAKGDEINFDNPVILGSDALGEKTKRAEKVGAEAAENLIREINSKTAADFHLADQLLPYMAFFGGRIKTSEITEHTKTNIAIIEKFLDVKFTVKGDIIESINI
jgi:RNA 3'-phosphate cyclase